jgi:hypothetical protein
MGLENTSASKCPEERLKEICTNFNKRYSNNNNIQYLDVNYNTSGIPGGRHNLILDK